jgi:hypothetical protein
MVGLGNRLRLHFSRKAGLPSVRCRTNIPDVSELSCGIDDTLPTEHTAAIKEKAISHTAHKCLSDLFPSQVSSFNSDQPSARC